MLVHSQCTAVRTECTPQCAPKFLTLPLEYRKLANELLHGLSPKAASSRLRVPAPRIVIGCEILLAHRGWHVQLFPEGKL